VRTGRDRLDALALSPDGKLVAYQLMGGVGSSTDWEIYVSDAAGVHRRITRDIQHDLLPKFLTNTALLGVEVPAPIISAAALDVLHGQRPELPLAEHVAFGAEEARRLLERFVRAGIDKFVLVPVADDLDGWLRELHREAVSPVERA